MKVCLILLLLCVSAEANHVLRHISNPPGARHIPDVLSTLLAARHIPIDPPTARHMPPAASRGPPKVAAASDPMAVQTEERRAPDGKQSNTQKAVRGEGGMYMWPIAIMEVSSLWGRCEQMSMTMTAMDNLFKGTIVGRVCPVVHKVLDAYLDSDDETQMEFERQCTSHIRLLQCIDIMFTEHCLEFLHMTTENSLFLREAEPLFEMCEEEFGSFHTELDDFEANMADLFPDARALAVKKMLRELVALVSKKKTEK
ncbi:uncharacterized protein LOC128204134 [Mya arenaria]|uniref:uncharacterized protein LOC128204134 n=1 Tax=Mya arenaria TaxID=6604 RepID=UPI0022E3C567|nr:uncharacterized protein LOC128204134 [Mya arenaria]